MRIRRRGIERKPEGNQGSGSSSDERSEGDTRMFTAHQQSSSKGRAGHTRPENRKRREEADLAVHKRLHKMGEKRLQKSQQKQNGNHFKWVEGLSSGIP